MKTRLLVLLISFTMNANSQVPVWKLNDLENYCKTNDTMLVINFWATWCKPCVKELPHFDVAFRENKGKPIKFLLVSLDFKRELEPRVKKFVESKNIQAPVVLLDEPDYNSWIDKVDPGWSGAIPGTLFVDRKGNKKFVEKEFEEKELLKAVEEMLNKP